MSSRSKLNLGLLIAAVVSTPSLAQDLGRRATPQEIAAWDIDVRPDGKGLPAGVGSVQQGREVYDKSCRACHGADGQGGRYDRLVGGQGTLSTNQPLKTVGSYWPYSTTLFDYIRRAMPYQAPGSLGADEAYALTAYILNLNGIVPTDAQLGPGNLAAVKMPNRQGFVPDPEFSKLVRSKK